MSSVYRHGQEVKVAIPCVRAETGETVRATAVSYRVVNAAGDEIVPLTEVADFVPDSSSVTVTVSSAENQIADDVTRDMRRVEIFMTADDGEAYNFVRYFLQRDDSLVVMGNSFQTYEQALLVALDLPNLGVWNAKCEQEHKAALIKAFHALCGMRYVIPGSLSMRAVSYEPGRRGSMTYINRIAELSKEEFEGLNERFVNAIRRAQVVEADVILGGDPVGDLRRAGLISHTTGESSGFFGTNKPLNLAVSERALRELQGFMTYATYITRV